VPGAKVDPFGCSDPFGSLTDSSAPTVDAFADFANFSQTKVSGLCIYVQ